MTTPLGGPSQILVKCRNNQNSAGNDIRAGDAVYLEGHVYDTNTGEIILLVSPLGGTAASHALATKFLGIAVSKAAASASGASGTGEYCHVCVFGLVQARVSNVGSAAIVPGEKVVGGGTVVAFEDGASGLGVLGDSAAGTSPVTLGIAVQTGAWGSSGGSQALSWIFLNGLGRHAFGGS